MRPTDAEKEFGIPHDQLSRADKRVRETWEIICNEKGLVCEPIALRPSTLALVLELEAEQMELAPKAGPKKRKAKKPRR